MGVPQGALLLMSVQHYPHFVELIQLLLNVHLLLLFLIFLIFLLLMLMLLLLMLLMLMILSFLLMISTHHYLAILMAGMCRILSLHLLLGLTQYNHC